MIERMVMMNLFNLSMILGSGFLPPPTLPTPWMNGTLVERMAGMKHAAGLLFAFLRGKSLLQ